MNRYFKCGLIFTSVMMAAFALSSCSSTKDAEKHSKNAAGKIISQPFRDLNLIKTDIPPALAQITDPYATPDVADCDWINYQLSELDKALGPDPIMKAREDQKTLSEQGSELAVEATNDAINSAATGIIPARGIVRKLTGAEKRDKKYNRAIEMGKIRRGYLNGLAEAKKCRGQ
jgi:hypothetical protein